MSHFMMIHNTLSMICYPSFHTRLLLLFYVKAIVLKTSHLCDAKTLSASHAVGTHNNRGVGRSVGNSRNDGSNAKKGHSCAQRTHAELAPSKGKHPCFFVKRRA